MRPEVGWINPAMSLSNVVFPAPEGPVNAIMPPPASEKSTSMGRMPCAVCKVCRIWTSSGLSDTEQAVVNGIDQQQNNESDRKKHHCVCIGSRVIQCFHLIVNGHRSN